MTMENILSFLESNLDMSLLIIIIFGGIFITKYTKSITLIKNSYKVLIISIILSALFYIANDCKSQCFNQYMFTYLFATSFYELLVKLIVDKIHNVMPSRKKK